MMMALFTSQNSWITLVLETCPWRDNGHSGHRPHSTPARGLQVEDSQNRASGIESFRSVSDSQMQNLFHFCNGSVRIC